MTPDTSAVPMLRTLRRYPCGCEAEGPGDVPAYCPTHERAPMQPTGAEWSEDIGAKFADIVNVGMKGPLARIAFGEVVNTSGKVVPAVALVIPRELAASLAQMLVNTEVRMREIEGAAAQSAPR